MYYKHLTYFKFLDPNRLMKLLKTSIRYARKKNREKRETPSGTHSGERLREINKIEIDTYIFVKWNQQIKLGRFRQNITEKTLQEKVT